MVDLGNGGPGVSISGGAANNTVGGAGENVIAFNDIGVAVQNATSTDNDLRGNNIFENDNLGIDLGVDGFTPNDFLDPDVGPNNFQNFPDLLGAVIDGSGDLVITYEVTSDPANSLYPLEIDFYIADADDEEGDTFVETDTYGLLDFGSPKQVNLGNAVGLGVIAGDRLVAIATDANGNTSEFTAPDIGVVPIGPMIVNTTADNTTFADGICTLREAIGNANANGDTTGGDCEAGGLAVDAIQFNIQGAGPHTIALTSALPDISDPVFIDGETEPGASCGTGIPARTLQVELDGSSAGAGANGLTLGAGSSGSTIRGLVINRFDDHGISIQNSNGNTVTCSFLGTDVTGTLALGNQQGGGAIVPDRRLLKDLLKPGHHHT